ncbi:hypothetical protein [Brevibacterium linens]|uniref:hypothetical protein n=1 Tax=Brevibacterium linens TaxID=1703 RepID=UPI003BF582AE
MSPNDYLGKDGGAQSYTGREANSTDVPVAPTGSSGGQTKYLIWAIHDEQYEPGLTPADKVNDPRNNYEWVSSTDGLTFPHVPLVKLVQPANTATITNSMLTDIREVANPRKHPELRTYAVVASDTQDLNSSSAYPAGQTWPVAVEDAWGEIPIPSWATRAKVIMMWTGVRTSGANVYGGIWVQIGQTVNTSNKKTQYVEYNSANPSDVTRDVLVAADNVHIPAALRGTSQKFYPRGNRRSSGAGRIRLDGASSMVLQVEFLEQAD